MWKLSRYFVAAILLVRVGLKHRQVQADTVWAHQDVPITVHAFLETGQDSEPCLKRPCTSVTDGCAGFSANTCSLSFYVRLADHPGKFDVEAAKAFALVPRLHYAALKRGETVVASKFPIPPTNRLRAFLGIISMHSRRRRGSSMPGSGSTNSRKIFCRC